MAWQVYAVSPIDFGWHHLPLAKQVAADIAREKAAEVVHSHIATYDAVGRFLSAVEEAKATARSHGWEGDYKGYAKPRVFWLPDPDSGGLKYGFMWKQDNNGTTFIVSPFPLPWLE